jgi:acyl-ACP thioesterase
MSTPIDPWTETFRVRSYDVAPHGRAAIQALCNYFQEAAGNHAEQLGFSRDAMLEHGTAWVLMRLRIAVERYPEWQHTVTVETWPSGVDGLYATREFVLRDADGDLLARGTSAWAVIDVERRRPTRIPSELDDLDPPDRPRPIDFASRRVPSLGRVDRERRFDVRFSDLDLNQHVNNVRYVEWALEAAPEPVLLHQQPADIDIQFRAETTFGQAVVTQLQQDDGRFLHRVQRAGDDRVVAQATTQWAPADD